MGYQKLEAHIFQLHFTNAQAMFEEGFIVTGMAIGAMAIFSLDLTLVGFLKLMYYQSIK